MNTSTQIAWLWRHGKCKKTKKESDKNVNLLFHGGQRNVFVGFSMSVNYSYIPICA